MESNAFHRMDMNWDHEPLQESGLHGLPSATTGRRFIERSDGVAPFPGLPSFVNR